MLVLVSTWIPRSYIHLYEIHRSIKKFHFEVENIELDDRISFKIKRPEGDVVFSLDGFGQYTLLGHVKNIDRVDKFSADMKVILHEIIDKSHGVVRKQIKRGILPLNFYTAIISKNKFKPKAKRVHSGNVDVYYNIEDTYISDTKAFFSGSESDKHVYLAEYLGFTSLMNHFLFNMMDKMEEYYHKAQKMSDVLEDAVNLDSLRRFIFDFDLIKKNGDETRSKIEQALNNYEDKMEIFESENFGKIAEDIGLNSAFERIESDWNYVSTLWDLLLSYQDNIDNAAEARMTFQESVEARKMEGFLSLETASVIAYLILGMFVTEFTGMWGLVLLTVFLVVWILVYTYIVRHRKRRRVIKG